MRVNLVFELLSLFAEQVHYLRLLFLIPEQIEYEACHILIWHARDRRYSLLFCIAMRCCLNLLSLFRFGLNDRFDRGSSRFACLNGRLYLVGFFIDNVLRNFHFWSLCRSGGVDLLLRSSRRFLNWLNLILFRPNSLRDWCWVCHGFLL